MRPLFGFAFGLTLFASLLTVRAQAEDDSVYRVTYVEALPFDALSPQSGVALQLEHYRDASRKEAGNARFDVLTELGRPNRFVILEVWRNTTSADAHDKADSTAKFRQTMDKVQSAPLDMRANAALFADPQPRDFRAGTVYVVTHVDVTGDHKDDAVTLLLSMSDESRKDDGSERYDVFQQKNRPNHFTVVEAWINRRAQANHTAAPHTRAFRGQLLPMQGALYDERIYVPLP
ncbi:MAG TPA: antibiotic biosynthesis monooxygenase [Xanthobacteraceae bacterium]|jgi:quinol monooxygenase YgiN|nr:antibiotic biosynthesis monooxygenase [Xanthobacteraceae bacterium]